MTWTWIVLLVAGGLALAALFYWQLIIAEGTYLGPRVVAWTYDLVARRYDAIKQFQPHNESWFVARPVLRGLEGVEQPLVLDVATGSGRLPLALLRERFRGQIVGLDLSRGMLRQAWTKLRPYGHQVSLIWEDASHLPFGDATFDAVTCLESLEFLPRPLAALAEMVRVLAPGGVLFLTNRVGHEAHLFPGRAIPRPQFTKTLAALSLQDIEVRRWQVNYDLAIARKNGSNPRAGVRSSGEQRDGVDVATLLRCPECSHILDRGVASLACQGCGRLYPIRNGVVLLADSKAIKSERS
jgi:ubiquinone/menaquinone biosynthesis C-methylase UbiE/uncharacterized protein YbaR (Trm112 family)